MSKYGVGPRSLRISSNGPTSSVHLDDQDISAALRGLTLRLNPGDMPQARLDVVALDVSTYSDDVQVYLPDATRDLLVRLGWTPPAEEATDAVH